MDLLHLTRSGLILDFSKKLPKEYKLSECLATLYDEKRFSNQSNLSVLEHLYAVGNVLRVSNTSNKALIVYGYTHDLQEAIIRDVPSPFKRVVPGFEVAEAEIESRLFNHFGIDFSLPTKKENTWWYSTFKFIDSFAAEVEMDMFFNMTSEKLCELGYLNEVGMEFKDIRNNHWYWQIKDEITNAFNTPKDKIVKNIIDYIFYPN